MEAFYNTSGVRYAAIYETGGKDMWSCVQEKLKKRMPNKRLSSFLKDEIGVRQRTICNKNDELHCENEDTFWIVNNLKESLLQDAKLYKKYEVSHGAWFHMELPDIKMNGLLDGVEMLEKKIEEKFHSWEIEYKHTKIVDLL